MGSWNATCGLTQLAIERNEEVALFVMRAVVQSTSASSVLLGESPGFSPILVPFYGKYDDYGSVELDADRIDYHLRALRMLDPRVEDNADFVDNPDKLLSKFLKGLTAYNPDRPKKAPILLGAMLVKKSAMDAALADIGSQTKRIYSDDVSIITIDSVNGSKDYLRRPLYTSVLEEATSLITANSRRSHVHDDFDNMGDLGSDARLKIATLGEELQYILGLSTAVGYTSNYLLPEMVTPEIITGLVDINLMRDAMMALRKPWSPGLAGSQDTEWKLTKTMAQYVIEEASRKRRF